MVTVAGAVSVAVDALLAQAQRVERRREAVVEPRQLAREVGERADREPGVGGEPHPSSGRSGRPWRCSESTSMPPTSEVAGGRACRRSAAGRARRRPSALASSWPIAVGADREVRRAGARRSTPWPTSAGRERRCRRRRAPVASTSASAASGAMSGACSVRRPSIGAAAVLASASPVSRFGPTIELEARRPSGCSPDRARRRRRG